LYAANVTEFMLSNVVKQARELEMIVAVNEARPTCRTE
jgi:hypothetical protein